MIPVFVGAGFPRPVVTKTAIENHYVPVNCRVGPTIVDFPSNRPLFQRNYLLRWTWMCPSTLPAFRLPLLLLRIEELRRRQPLPDVQTHLINESVKIRNECPVGARLTRSDCEQLIT